MHILCYGLRVKRTVDGLGRDRTVRFRPQWWKTVRSTQIAFSDSSNPSAHPAKTNIVLTSDNLSGREIVLFLPIENAKKKKIKMLKCLWLADEIFASDTLYGGAGGEEKMG